MKYSQDWLVALVFRSFIGFLYRNKNLDKPRRSFLSILGFKQADLEIGERF